jgi:hypothetical protein
MTGRRSVAMSVGGYGGSTVAVAGGLLPVVYHADTWFTTDAWCEPSTVMRATHEGHYP